MSLGTFKVVEQGSISSGALTIAFSEGGIYLVSATSQWNSSLFIVFYSGATPMVTSTDLKTGEVVRNPDANSTFTVFENTDAFVVYSVIKLG